MKTKKRYLILAEIVIIASLWFVQRLIYPIWRDRRTQMSMIDFYNHSHQLTTHGFIDPPCDQIKNIYFCAGTCPWSNTHDNQLVSCSFLPRKLYPDFVQHKVYCSPEPDHCLNYNAWLKDTLPLTKQLIKRIPDHLLANFTLNYSIPVDSASQMFRTDGTLPANWTISYIEKYRKQVRAREAYGSYGNRDIYPALDKYASIAIENKTCAVIGTENPWIEAALLEYNASKVTTIEYATIYSSTPHLHVTTPMDFAQRQYSRSKRELFDSVWSYSSLEHDGLGRYGDPLNPYGDLQTMTKITCILKPGGFLFLSVPLNIQDLLVYNLHRIYGPIRLPLLYRNFHIVEVFDPGMSHMRGDAVSQPFVVLQSKIGCKSG